MTRNNIIYYEYYTYTDCLRKIDLYFKYCSDSDVLTIRNEAKTKAYVDIAKSYGVSPSTIRKVVLRKTRAYL